MRPGEVSLDDLTRAIGASSRWSMRPGEVSLDELERAFRETAPEVVRRAPQPAPAPRLQPPKQAARQSVPKQSRG